MDREVERVDGAPTGRRPVVAGSWPAPHHPEPSRALVAFLLGIAGVALPSVQIVAPFAWWLGAAERKAIREGRRDPEGRGLALAGMVLGIIGTALLVLGIAVVLWLVGALVLGFGWLLWAT